MQGWCSIIQDSQQKKKKNLLKPNHHPIMFTSHNERAQSVKIHNHAKLVKALHTKCQTKHNALF